MADSSTALKEWLKSKPTKIDQGTFLQMMLLAARAIDEVEKDNAQLKAEVNALETGLTLIENKIPTVESRLTVLETKG